MPPTRESTFRESDSYSRLCVAADVLSAVSADGTPLAPDPLLDAIPLSDLVHFGTDDDGDHPMLNIDDVRAVEADKIDFERNSAKVRSRLYGPQRVSRPPADPLAIAEQQEIRAGPEADDATEMETDGLGDDTADDERPPRTSAPRIPDHLDTVTSSPNDAVDIPSGQGDPPPASQPFVRGTTRRFASAYTDEDFAFHAPIGDDVPIAAYADHDGVPTEYLQVARSVRTKLAEYQGDLPASEAESLRDLLLQQGNFIGVVAKEAIDKDDAGVRHVLGTSFANVVSFLPSSISPRSPVLVLRRLRFSSRIPTDS